MTPRKYDARLRRERGTASRQESRRKILEAARTLFLEHGYAATTVKAIAESAGVGTATIYAAPLTKRDILLAIRDVDLAGNDEPVPLLEQSWTQTVAAEPDAQRQLVLWVHHLCEISGRVEPILEVLRQASAADPQLEADCAEDERKRDLTQRGMVALLTRWRPHRHHPWPTADALDVLLTPESYHRLHCERRWSADDIERWCLHMMGSSVFEEDS